MFKSLLKLLGLYKETQEERSKRELDEQIESSIQDFINRPVYKILTKEIIDSTNDDQLLQTVFDNLSEKLPEDYDKWYDRVSDFNKYQQAIYVIWCLEAEVNNGGFNQYYTNSSGKFASLTPNALKLVGANEFANLLERVNNIYETEYEKIIMYQDGTLDGFSKSYDDNPLNEFDDKFFEYYEKENLSQLQIDFIRKNKDQFID